MLKGFVLSRFQEANDRDRINTFWKKAVQDLHIYDKDEDQQFFQAWLRSQYAVTIRQSKAGAANEDFEKIGAGFHSWVRENLENMGLSADQPSGFQSLVHTEMKYYLKYYREILDARKKEKPGLEHVYYIEQWGIANSLSMPLMLAPLQSSDSEEIARKKINAVARYIETFSVRRSINYRKFGASSIRYTMFTLVKELRRLNLDQLNEKLRSRLNEMEETWDGMAQFGLHGQNRNFVKFLLSRITAFIEQSAKHSTYFSTYHARQGSNQFEVEHIWADKFTEHQDEFEQQHEFEAYRNRIGDLVLLPGGTNQSYGAKPYSEKLEHYVKENLLVKSLHNLAYENNPNFTKMIQRLDLPFKAHDSFSKADIDERQLLYQRICEVIWNEDDFLEKADAAE